MKQRRRKQLLVSSMLRAEVITISLDVEVVNMLKQAYPRGIGNGIRDALVRVAKGKL